MNYLELLAPARNTGIGIAAIDCGADAVYMAGPGFGARKAAGNSIEEVARLCQYAHRFGARVFLTVNTIIYDNELEAVHSMMLDAVREGVDAFIVQDLAITQWDDIPVPIHASTQCSIRTPERARFYESLGFSRLVLERELSLAQIRAIRDAVDCELECFVHGALCVCYSGQCYMSERISRRSANRGECIQACRSLYDLVDGSGRIIVKNKALLSLKDLNLIGRLEELADAGAVSFKIEGRLKNISYVKNTVREYSLALDELVRKHPDKYCRASFGKISGGFTPDLNKTFNRGYTTLFSDGKKDLWSSMNAPKSMGEYIGNVISVSMSDASSMILRIRPEKGVSLKNGDGFAFVSGSEIIGFRGDVCTSGVIQCKAVREITEGTRLYRNINAAFEKELDANVPHRHISIRVNATVSGRYCLELKAWSEDGRTASVCHQVEAPSADNRERMTAMISSQLSKSHLIYDMHLENLAISTDGGSLPLLSAAFLNSIRRELCEAIDAQECHMTEMRQGLVSTDIICPYEPSYKDNVANRDSLRILKSRGGKITGRNAYELEHQEGAELMRSKYCIKYELGLCPVRQGARPTGPLFLTNNGKKFALEFDCSACEMTVRDII